MKAAQIQAWGSIDNIKIESVNVPTPNENEVLIEVVAAGVNPIDWKVIEGYFSSFMENCFPFSLGWDVSGKVVGLGKGVTQFKEGDEVFGLIRFPQPAGTFAEYTTAPVDQIVLKPKLYDHIHCAATPLVALTAWQALFTTAHLDKNQTVLIHAAAGGVGQFAIQLAKIKGAKVIAVGSSQSKALLTELGADQFIDYKTTKFEDVVKNVDCVLDPLSDDTSFRSLKVLKEGGKLVKLLSNDLDELKKQAQANNVQVNQIIVSPNGKDLDDIAKLMNDQLLKINVIKTYPLSNLKEALKLMKEGHSHGKIVIQL